MGCWYWAQQFPAPPACTWRPSRKRGGRGSSRQASTSTIHASISHQTVPVPMQSQIADRLCPRSCRVGQRHCRPRFYSHSATSNARRKVLWAVTLPLAAVSLCTVTRNPKASLQLPHPKLFSLPLSLYTRAQGHKLFTRPRRIHSLTILHLSHVSPLHTSHTSPRHSHPPLSACFPLLLMTT